jgi:chondroitin AC lyase
VHLKNDLQSGAWSDIGTGPEKDVIKDVFGLWIDHGSEVSGGSYQYIVLPGTTAQQTNEEAEHLPLKILSDTPAVQAVWHEQLNLLEAAFHTACELKAEGMEISVNQPCLLMIKNVGGKMQLTLSSPQNITGPINVSIRQQNGSPKRVQVELPTGLMSGSSVVRQITN